MPKIPCPTKIDQCLPCNDDPIENFSSEAPDKRVFLGNGGWDGEPPIGDPIRIFRSPGCIGICQSVVSQEDADLCARRQALLCVVNGDRPPIRLFYNKAELCTVNCPDGSLFSWSVPARMVSSLWQTDANARALALACKEARARRVCINDLPDGCVDEAYSKMVTAKGAGLDEFAVWEVLDGSVPPGLVFMGGEGAAAVLTGTPTASGTYTFTVRVTLSDGARGQRIFQMRIVGISPESLPDGSLGSVYSQQLSASPGDAASQTWLLTGSGVLPAGLSLSASGLVSGTPTESGDFTFGVRVEDSSTGMVCERNLTIGVQAIPPATLYWTLDDTRVDSVVGLVLGGGAPNNYVAGRINHGFRLPTTINASRELEVLSTASAAYITGQDLSYSFWINWAAGLGGADVVLFEFVAPGGAWWLRVLWQQVFGNPRLTLDVYNGVDISSVFAVYPMTIGQWDFIAVSYKAATGLATVYLNGAVFLTSSTPVTLPTSGLNSIRYRETGGIFGIATDFKVDELGWWIGTALTAAQVSELYNAGAGQRPPNVP